MKNKNTIIIVVVVVLLLVIGVIIYMYMQPKKPIAATSATNTNGGLFGVLSNLLKPKTTPTTVTPVYADDGGDSDIENMFDTSPDDGGDSDIENMFDTGS